MPRIITEKLSESYHVYDASLTDPEKLYSLYRSNQFYFDYFSIEPTVERLQRDMTMLPEGCDRCQKHFLAYCDDLPEAILDIIEGYPTENTCYIGLFMVKHELTGKGVGTKIITELCSALAGFGFKAVRLAYGKHYERAVHFWTKNGFVPVKEALLDEYGELIIAERKL